MHSIFAPSSAHRWVRCPGSVRAELQYPDVESDAAREGTAAHWVAETVLLSYATDSIVTAGSLLNETAPNGVVITEEMIEGAEIYISDVLKICNDVGGLRFMQVEKQLIMPSVSNEMFGTSDCVIYDESLMKLYVWDFKFGRVAVDVRQNWQLMSYAIGALHEVTGGNGITDQHVSVELRIVQPRAFHVEGVKRDLTITGAELRGYANNLHDAAFAAVQDEPPTRSGDWCKDCKASRSCLTLQRSAADIAERIEVLDLNALSANDRSFEIAYLRKANTLLNERLSALEDEALTLHMQGEPTPGFSVGNGRGSTRWTVDDDVVIAIGEAIGKDFRKTQPITPKQAEKLNVDQAVIKQYSEHFKGSPRLVETKETTTSRMFSK